MTTFSFKATFIKYARPLIQQLLAQINKSACIVVSDGTDRPENIRAGSYWEDDNGVLYLYTGSEDIIASTARPSGLADGDLWIDLSDSTTPTMKVDGTIDVNMSVSDANIIEQDDYEITDAEAETYYNNL